MGHAAANDTNEPGSIVQAASVPRARRRGGSIVSGAVVTIGALAVLSALRWLEWASRDDGTARRTFTGGPTQLLAGAAIASCVLAVLVALSRTRWPGTVMLTTAVVTAVTAVVVALSRIAAANAIAVPGASRTSYEPGAAVAVLAALVMVGAAIAGKFDR